MNPVRFMTLAPTTPYPVPGGGDGVYSLRGGGVAGSTGYPTDCESFGGCRGSELNVVFSPTVAR